jgi:hypothetical protein
MPPFHYCRLGDEIFSASLEDCRATGSCYRAIFAVTGPAPSDWSSEKSAARRQDADKTDSWFFIYFVWALVVKDTIRACVHPSDGFLE